MKGYPRRVAATMQVLSSPRPNTDNYFMIRVPRISSTCANRPPIWEWRISQGILTKIGLRK